jgi:hypothetical protein
MNTQARIRTRSLVALTALVAIAATASADPSYPLGSRYRAPASHATADGNIVDVQVKVDGGIAPLFFKPGTSDRHYFQAYQGRNYSVVLRNSTGRRIGVLIAVDGLNVVNGERSTLDRHEQMYVLDPYESADIQGWRTSLDEVRRFVFVDEQRSYAERTGQANGDMGWIRVVAYREVERQPWWGRWTPARRERDDSRAQDGAGRGLADEPQATNEAAPAPSLGDAKSAKPEGESRSLAGRLQAQDQAPQSAPGTGWGDRSYDPVQQTSFEPQAWAADRISLRYEYASGLRALGIELRQPRVFERDRGELGFAKPPRW